MVVLHGARTAPERYDSPRHALTALLQPAAEDLDWQESALCTQVDAGDLFFPEKGGSTKEAKRVCRGCPVQTKCLEYALGNGERFGIWGSLSERERRALVKQRQTTPALMSRGDLDYEGSAIEFGDPTRCECGAVATHRISWESVGTGAGLVEVCDDHATGAADWAVTDATDNTRVTFELLVHETDLRGRAA